MSFGDEREPEPIELPRMTGPDRGRLVSRPHAPVLLGLDLSVTAAAAVAVPVDWDGEWKRVRSVVVGEKLRRDATDLERARRTETIATRLVAFARATGATCAFIESYGFAMRTAAHTLGEIGGVVRLELVRAGIEVRTANMGTARKLLLGKVPRSDAKMAVYAALRAAGARFETGDEADAMAAVNLGLSELGAFCFAQSADNAA
jgi:Holliday junction resolvasome RuvABC endonuclease subunit